MSEDLREKIEAIQGLDVVRSFFEGRMLPESSFHVYQPDSVDKIIEIIMDERKRYAREYAVQELEKIKDKLMTQDVIGRSLGQVVIDSVDYIDEAIARLNEELNQPKTKV